jgi:hypothetical protein
MGTLSNNDVDVRNDPCSRMNGLDPTADYELYVVQLQEWARLTACELLNTYSRKCINKVHYPKIECEQNQPHTDLEY